jgi:hypothetical protein
MIVRRDPGVYSRLTTQSYIDPAFWAEPFWRPGARHARSKTKGAPTRSIKSPGGRRRGPRRLDGLFHPVRMNQRGMRAAAEKTRRVGM